MIKGASCEYSNKNTVRKHMIRPDERITLKTESTANIFIPTTFFRFFQPETTTTL